MAPSHMRERLVSGHSSWDKPQSIARVYPQASHQDWMMLYMTSTNRPSMLYMIPNCYKGENMMLESLPGREKVSVCYAEVKCRFQEACKAINSHSKPASSDAFQQQSYNAPSKKQHQHPTNSIQNRFKLQTHCIWLRRRQVTLPRGSEGCQLTPQTSTGIHSKSVP